MMCHLNIMCFFFFNDTATTEIYTLSLHDALPISRQRARPCSQAVYPQHPRDSLRFKRLSRPHLRRSTAPPSFYLLPPPASKVLREGRFNHFPSRHLARASLRL